MQTSEEGSLELGSKSSNVLQWNALDYCKKFSLGRNNTNILTSVCGNISIIILTPPISSWATWRPLTCIRHSLKMSCDSTGWHALIWCLYFHVWIYHLFFVKCYRILCIIQEARLAFLKSHTAWYMEIIYHLKKEYHYARFKSWCKLKRCIFIRKR